MKQNTIKKLRSNYLLFLGLLLIFCTNTIKAQSGVALHWDTEVGCQSYFEDDKRKEIFLEDITDGVCLRVCEGAKVVYTLTGPLGGAPATVWSVAGGTMTAHTDSTCNITWGASGAGSLTFVINLPTGTVTKTLCFEKIIKPTASFNMAPYVAPTKYIVSCINQTLNFVNSSTANGGTNLVSYFWDFGDGSYSTALNPSHMYTEEGTYAVVLTVTNACNCTATYRRSIKVFEKGFDISCPTVVCEKQRETYTLPEAVQEKCTDNYNWTTEQGTINSINPANGDVTVTWDHVGASGFGYLTFNPEKCGLSCLLPTTIKVPVILAKGTIVGDANVCNKDQNIYKLPQWPTTDFHWEVVGNVGNSLANLFLSDQRNEVVVQPLIGTGTITLRCTYNNTLLGCGGTAEFVINVSKPIDFTGNFVLCNNTTGTYTTGGVPTTWTLKNSAGATITTASASTTFSYNFTTAGGYTLSVGGAGTCPAQVKNITVVSSPTTPLASSLTGELLVCPNAPYQYSMPNDPTVQYHWSVTNGTISGASIGNQVTVSFTGVTPAQLVVYKESLSPMICPSAPVTIPVTIRTINVQINSGVVEGACANSTTSTYNANNFGTSTLYTEGETYNWTITPANLGSITAGQGTKTITVTWNNVTASTAATLSLVIHKCTIITPPITLTVNIKPIPTIAVTPSVNPVCSSVPVTFTVTSITPGITLLPGATVAWTFNGVPDPSQTGLTATHSFYNISGAPINPNVTATITNPNGCTGTTNTASTTVTVKPEPTATNSMTSTGGNVFCNSWEINTQLGSGTAAGATIQWYYVVGSTTTTVPAPQGQAGTLDTSMYGFARYYFIATKNGCSTTSNSIYVTQNCAPPLPCVLNPVPTVVNNASSGCQPASTTVVCSNCDHLNLDGSAPGSLSQTWTVIGPTNYSGPATAGLTIPAVVGVYNTLYKAAYTCTNGTTGYVSELKNVKVPYLCDLDYAISCTGNSTFNVALSDKSSYYHDVTGVTYKYYYKLHSASWPASPVATTSTTTLSSLAPGQYDIRLVIQGLSDGVLQTPCEKTYTITLASVPLRTITYTPFPTIPCHDTAVQFGLSGLPVDGDSYLWTFEAGAENTLASPQRVFSSPGLKTVTVVITNKYGCSRTLTTTITVPPPCFNGNVSSPLTTVCMGSPVTINYVPSGDNCTASQYIWMNGQNPIAGAPNAASINVYTPGFYWVKVQKGSCNYDTPARITPIFKSAPSISLQGPGATCEGDDVVIKAITTATVIRWIVDSSPQPGFNNLATITLSGLSLGSHTITATAYSGTVGAPDTCMTTATQMAVIVATPDKPEITQEVFCAGQVPEMPYYHVVLSATSNVSEVFNWSNGMSGSPITVTDGGPYQVRVTSGGCSSKSQVDVPKNLEDFIWIFPTGCIDACNWKEGEPTLIGPRLPLDFWEWIYNGNTEFYGHHSFPQPLHLTAGSGTYNLALTQGECTLTSGALEYTERNCDKCAINSIRVVDVKDEDQRYCSFKVTLQITSMSGFPATITVPNNNAVINPAGFNVAAGTNNYVFTVFPMSGFTGGSIAFQINGVYENGKPCITEFKIDIPSCVGEINTKIDATATVVMPVKVTLAPNPAKEQVTVHYNGLPSAASVELYDITGRSIANYAINTTDGDLVVPTNNYPSGIYIVVVRTDKGLLSQQKLVIE